METYTYPCDFYQLKGDFKWAKGNLQLLEMTRSCPEVAYLVSIIKEEVVTMLRTLF